jgi:hypothetical protein
VANDLCFSGDSATICILCEIDAVVCVVDTRLTTANRVQLRPTVTTGDDVWYIGEAVLYGQDAAAIVPKSWRTSGHAIMASRSRQVVKYLPSNEAMKLYSNEAMKLYSVSTGRLCDGDGR